MPEALAAQLGLEKDFGVVIDTVIEGSPAEKAGLQAFDVIKLINDQRVLDSNHLAKLVQSFGENAEVTITCLRQAREEKFNVKLGMRMQQFNVTARVSDDLSPMARGMDFLRRYPTAGAPESRPMDDVRWRVVKDRPPVWVPADLGPDLKRLRQYEAQLRDFQQQMAKFQKQLAEWAKTHDGDLPNVPPPPALPSFDQSTPPAPPHPGGSDDSTDSSVNHNEVTIRNQETRAIMKDDDGEVQVEMKNGKRTLQARSRDGKLVFKGPIDTPEQLNEVPALFREKIKAIEMRQSAVGRRGDIGGPRQDHHTGAGSSLNNRELAPFGSARPSLCAERRLTAGERREWVAHAPSRAGFGARAKAFLERILGGPPEIQPLFGEGAENGTRGRVRYPYPRCAG